MEQTQIYSAFNISIDMCIYGGGNANDTAQTTLVSAFVCPSDGNSQRIGDNVAFTNYFAVLGCHRRAGGGLYLLEYGADHHALGNLHRPGQLRHAAVLGH